MVCEGYMLRRTVLWYLVFTGCGVNYMVRTNLNIAIIAMVKHVGIDENNIVVSECQLNRNTSTFSNSTGLESVSYEQTERYNWDEHQQAQILGAFFWTYWISQVIGGVLAQKYGSKIVFGFSNLFISLSTFLIPLSAMIDYRVLVALRTFQGLVGGLAWPSLHDLTAKWIPPDERSNFVTAYMGSSVGAALTYPLCGLISYYLGWKAVFHVTGAIGVLWFGSWWLMAYDTPADDPNISKKELQYIQESLVGLLLKRKPPIPWLKILKSIPLWILIFAHWGCLWGMFTLLTQGPTYFQNIHGWSIRMTGLLAGGPHIGRVILAIAVSYFCDSMLKHKTLSHTTVRKIATAISTTVQGVLMLGIAFSGCNALAAIILFTAATTASGAEAAGPLASYVDLGPNFASVVMGVGNMITVMPGFISPVIVGYLTYQNQTTSQWQLVFLISAVMTVVPGLVHLCCGSSTVQDWNSPEVAATELQILNTGQMQIEDKKDGTIDYNQNL